MKKVLILFAAAALALTACSGNTEDTQSTEVIGNIDGYDIIEGDNSYYLYQMSNDDLVSVSVNVTDNYSFVSENPFYLVKDNVPIFLGFFMSSDDYEDYKRLLFSDDVEEYITVLEEGTKSGNEYMLYRVEGTDDDGTMYVEYDYAISITDSETAVLMGTEEGEEEAKEAFSHIDFEYYGKDSGEE